MELTVVHFFLVALNSVPRVLGHAYMSWPPSRNFDKCNFYDPQSVNQHCSNCNTDVCGKHGAVDFAQVPHAATGSYMAGSLLDVEVIVTAHHRGYMELRLCNRPNILTQDCLDEHLLLRDDETAATDPAPVDEAYPGRWYMPPPGVNWPTDSSSDDNYLSVPAIIVPNTEGEHYIPNAVQTDTYSLPGRADANVCGRSKIGTRYRWKVRIPSDVQCEHCVLQWFWVTANSCNPHGLPEYFGRSSTSSWISERYGGGADAWWKSVLATCSAAVSDPKTNGNGAEKFWNCGDIAVTSCTGQECTTTSRTTATQTTTTRTTIEGTTTTRDENSTACVFVLDDCDKVAFCREATGGDRLADDDRSNGVGGTPQCDCPGVCGSANLTTTQVPYCIDSSGLPCSACLASNNVCYNQQESWCKQWPSYKWCGGHTGSVTAAPGSACTDVNGVLCSACLASNGVCYTESPQWCSLYPSFTWCGVTTTGASGTGTQTTTTAICVDVNGATCTSCLASNKVCYNDQGEAWCATFSYTWCGATTTSTADEGTQTTTSPATACIDVNGATCASCLASNNVCYNRDSIWCASFSYTWCGSRRLGTGVCAGLNGMPTSWCQGNYDGQCEEMAANYPNYCNWITGPPPQESACVIQGPCDIQGFCGKRRLQDNVDCYQLCGCTLTTTTAETTTTTTTTAMTKRTTTSRDEFDDVHTEVCTQDNDCNDGERCLCCDDNESSVSVALTMSTSSPIIATTRRSMATSTSSTVSSVMETTRTSTAIKAGVQYSLNLQLASIGDFNETAFTSELAAASNVDSGDIIVISKEYNMNATMSFQSVLTEDEIMTAVAYALNLSRSMVKVAILASTRRMSGESTSARTLRSAAMDAEIQVKTQDEESAKRVESGFTDPSAISAEFADLGINTTVEIQSSVKRSITLITQIVSRGDAPVERPSNEQLAAVALAAGGTGHVSMQELVNAVWTSTSRSSTVSTSTNGEAHSSATSRMAITTTTVDTRSVADDGTTTKYPEAFVSRSSRSCRIPTPFSLILGSLGSLFKLLPTGISPGIAASANSSQCFCYPVEATCANKSLALRSKTTSATTHSPSTPEPEPEPEQTTSAGIASSTSSQPEPQPQTPSTTSSTSEPEPEPETQTSSTTSSKAEPEPEPEPPPLNNAMVTAVIQKLQQANSAGVFMYDTGNGWVESDVYTWADMINAVQLMATHGVGQSRLWLGDISDTNVNYGLVNVAAFLAQCMQETIQYNACDENNWSDRTVVRTAGGSTYSAASACGQLHQSYQDYTCSAEDDATAGGQMACSVDPAMEARAQTQAQWYGAPPKMFCAPRSKVPKIPRWDYTGPWCPPPGGWGRVEPFSDDVPLSEYFQYVNSGGSCKDYTSIKAGGWTFQGEGCQAGSCPGSPAPLFGQAQGRSDVEGCCWWGRGVIQTTGVCNFGKLNFYLGKRAADEGRTSLYPNIDFCKDPGKICAPDGPAELKWVAGFFYWLNAVQPYSKGGWSYKVELKRWVDAGMNLGDTSFIDGASGIVNRGCHNPPNCGTGELHGGYNRVNNFRTVLQALRLK